MEEKVTSMIILKAIAYTFTIAVIVLLLIATLYISIWVMLAIAIILVFLAIRSALRGKEHLVRYDSSKL